MVTSASSDELAAPEPEAGESMTGPTGSTGRNGNTGRSRLGFGRRTRKSRPEGSSPSAPIVQASSVTGNSLTLVIAIMCFLACLTSGAVYIVNQSAAAWMRNVASEVSIQILPLREGNIDQRVTEVAFFLAKQAGVEGVRPLTLEESTRLLEPWLGKTEVLTSLPIPRLIALELNRSTPPDLELLGNALQDRFKGVRLDDHRHWQQQIRTVTRSLAIGGVAILLLVCAATTAIIVSATRSAMASNREIVEVLHFVGATDRFIAREFEKHFLSLGIRAGLVGAATASFVFLLLPTMTRLLGGAAVTDAELRRFVGSGALDVPGFLLLGIVVIVISALCMLTSRYGVFGILNSHD